MIPTQYADGLVQAKQVFKTKAEGIEAILYCADRAKGEWGTNFLPDVSELWELMDAAANFADGVPVIKAATNRTMFGIMLGMIWDTVPDALPDTDPVPDGGSTTSQQPWFDSDLKPIEGCDGPADLADNGLKIGGYIGESGQENIQLWGARKVGDWVKVYAASPRSANVGWCYWAAWTKGF